MICFRKLDKYPFKINLFCIALDYNCINLKWVFIQIPQTSHYELLSNINKIIILCHEKEINLKQVHERELNTDKRNWGCDVMLLSSLILNSRCWHITVGGASATILCSFSRQEAC